MTDPDWKEIRSRFPALGSQVYLNTAGGGPLSRDAFESARLYWDGLYQDGDRHWNRWMETVERTRARLADTIGASPDEIAFLANSSQGLNLVADMFSSDWTVVLADDDFPSVTLPWIQRGHRVRFVEAGSDGVIELPAVRSTLGPASETDRRLVAVSFVQYGTGFRFDLRALAEICSASRAPLVVDATQGFGVFPVDVGRTPLSAMMFSAYKWVGAGYGVAPLFVRKDILSRYRPPAVGWRSGREPYALENRKLDLTSEARGLELGHPPFPGIFALAGALDLIERIGLPAIEARVESLVDRLHRGLDERRIPFRSPRRRGQRSGIVMIDVSDPEGIVSELGRRGIFVSARRGALRVSVHYYNDERDLENLFRALDEIGAAAAKSSSGSGTGEE
jgi:selenocysteine lyase/cysteine desulfurase